jgi:hypothetical protein
VKGDVNVRAPRYHPLPPTSRLHRRNKAGLVTIDEVAERCETIPHAVP